jgi:threonylcarbamoyladenosine tRNA methylthiotransferase MtaB
MAHKVALHTLGCKLNYSETSTIANQFLDRKFNVVNFNEEADIYVFNTCSVTETAEKECRQLVRRALRKNPNAFVLLTGCYAQLRPEELARIEGVDAVLGSSEKFKLFSLIDDFKKKDLPCIYVTPTEDLIEFGVAHSTDADSRTRAYLKIQDGCDYNCSFCTVPLARGKSRSLPINQTVDEFKNLINKGYKEIILTGVNVGDYGKSIDSSLFNFLQQLIQIDGEFRIRISSIEPNLLTDKIIDLVAGNKKICNHLHIPLQSGSPRVLKSMHRRYSVKEYEEKILQATNSIKELGIGVDVIVGFPGETEEDFIHTHNFLRDLPISYLHVFTYSERPDTQAISLPGNVDVLERKRRNNILRILSEKKRNAFNKSMIGKELSVLFEQENKNGNVTGYSSNYVRVNTNYDESLINKICRVSINNVKNNSVAGEIMYPEKSIDLEPALD